MSNLKEIPTCTHTIIRDSTPSSLLVPDSIVGYFSMRSESFGGMKYYFRHLIITYGRHLDHFGLVTDSIKWKNEYQKPGLKLQKKNFKPSALLWEEFRHIGLAYGLAMCKLFTVLLELEYKRWVEAGCPDDFCEKPPSQSKIHEFGMNSSPNLLQGTILNLKKSFGGRNSSVLVRILDFDELKPDRTDFLYRICK